MQVELRRIWQSTQTTVIFITHDIDEAIILGTRVGVMTAGPGRLKADLPVEIEGERLRTDPRYTALYDHVHGVLRDEVERARQQSVAA